MLDINPYMKIELVNEGKVFRIYTPKETDNYTREYVEKYMNTYDIEVYHCTPEHVFQHHVAFTRCYLTCQDGKPLFTSSAEHLYSIFTLTSPNYYYFAGKKSTPVDVMYKYMVRGFYFDDDDTIPDKYLIEKNYGYVPTFPAMYTSAIPTESE